MEIGLPRAPSDEFKLFVAGDNDLKELLGICAFLRNVSVSHESVPFAMNGALIQHYHFDGDTQMLSYTPSPFIAMLSGNKTSRSFLQSLATPFLKSGQLKLDDIDEGKLHAERKELQALMMRSLDISTPLKERVTEDDDRDPLDALNDAILMLEVAEMRWQRTLFEAMQSSPTLREMHRSKVQNG
jgi:hypothetical protein